MIRFSFGVAGVLARCAALAAAAFVAACGSGAVSAPPQPVVLDPISITPGTATLYSETPTTFIITGGNGTYLITSSDQSALPVAGAFSGGNSITLVPNPVAADTPVTLTVRDTTSTTAPVTAALIVKPRTVSNVVSIVPSNADCGTAVCSAGDAEVSIKIAQNGLPLVNRTVRFEVVSGNFAIITSPPGLPETTSLSGIAVTDAAGFARIRIRVAVDAPSQTALMQIVDVGSGSSQRVSFVIAQNTGPSAGFFVTPSGFTFQGVLVGQCASSSLSADFYVFGGTPPYTVSNSVPDAFSVFPTVLNSRGDHFTVTPRNAGICIATPGSPITVRDSQGRTVSVQVASIEGTQQLPALTVSPASIRLSSCTDSGSINVVGGKGPPYTVSLASDSPLELRGNNGSTITIGRRRPSGPAPSSIPLSVTDGRSTANFTVELEPGAQGTCP